MPVSLPPEYQGQQASVDRRRKLAEALQAQAMAPLQARQAGQFLVAPSPLEGVAKLAQALSAHHQQGKADESQLALGQKVTSDRQTRLAQALQTAQGTPGSVPNSGMGFEEVGGQPANPMGAYAQLAGSGDPTLMQAGGNMMNLQAQEAARTQTQTHQTQQAQLQREAAAAQQQANREAAASRATESNSTRELIAQMAQANRPQPQQRQPQVIQTADGPMILGDDGTAKPITGPGGAQVKPSQGRVGPMTATAQKELIETEEGIQGGQAALSLFKQARALNDQAMGFTGAGAIASAGSLLPSFARPNAVDATQNLDNILQTAALPQLKAIFGGMPTEGERKILLDVQGSSSKPPAVRKDIFDRAEKAIQARLKFGAEKVKRLRDGSYFSGEGLPSIQMDGPPGAPSLTPAEEQELAQLRARFGGR